MQGLSINESPQLRSLVIRCGLKGTTLCIETLISFHLSDRVRSFDTAVRLKRHLTEALWRSRSRRSSAEHIFRVKPKVSSLASNRPTTMIRCSSDLNCLFSDNKADVVST